MGCGVERCSRWEGFPKDLEHRLHRVIHLPLRKPLEKFRFFSLWIRPTKKAVPGISRRRLAGSCWWVTRSEERWGNNSVRFKGFDIKRCFIRQATSSIGIRSAAHLCSGGATTRIQII
jgi:hypothetical protein